MWDGGGGRRPRAGGCRQGPCKEVFGHICLTHCCTAAAPHSIMTGHWHGSTTSCHLTEEFYHQRWLLNLASKLHSQFKSLKHINREILLFWSHPLLQASPPANPPQDARGKQLQYCLTLTGER